MVTPAALRRSGFTLTSYWRTMPPKLLTSTTPGTPASWRFTSQSCTSRSLASEYWFSWPCSTRNRVLENLAQAGGDGSHLGPAVPAPRSALGGWSAFRPPAAGCGGGHLVVEHHRNHRQPEPRDGADFLTPGTVRSCSSSGTVSSCSTSWAARAGLWVMHLHLVVGHVGDGIERQVHERVPAPAHEASTSSTTNSLLRMLAAMIFESISKGRRARAQRDAQRPGRRRYGPRVAILPGQEQGCEGGGGDLGRAAVGQPARRGAGQEVAGQGKHAQQQGKERQHSGGQFRPESSREHSARKITPPGLSRLRWALRFP